MKKAILVLMMLGFVTVCFAQAKISKENIHPKADYKAIGVEFYMTNLVCSVENTVLANVKNCKFIRCNIFNCILDGSNTFEKSIYYPDYNIQEPPKTEEEKRVIQLEKFITDNALIIPAKVER